MVDWQASRLPYHEGIGEYATAATGTVAAALRYLETARAGEGGLSTIVDKLQGITEHGLSTAQGKGVGERILTAFLSSIPGVTERTVRDYHMTE